ncbi:MAG: YbgC/YbaW family acyl-CoA thioester hydrolase [Roseivirga sp.]|jgi:YbgC/YbaW family acyl-CoA thioester hydrolase
MFIIDPNREYPKETESRVVIRFQDCDPLRHLNNAKYFDYFFNAREDQVPKIYEVEMKDFILAYDAVWVVYNHHISYLKPANMGEWVRINSRVVWFNENTLVVEYCMFDDAKSHLKTLMWSTFKYVGMKTSRTVEHSEEISVYLKAILYPGVDYHPHKFDDRIQQVKNLVRPTI